MATLYYEKDADPGLLAGRRVAIIGYGSQGHAHALNLKDSGVDVRVGLRPGSSSWAKAEEAGLRVVAIDQAAKEADVVMILLPDTEQAAVLETTFEEETETDLFGEQVVLCGGLTALVTAGFETLVGAGYQPESAYFECLHELKLIVDLMYEQGISGMRFSISDTAEYGDMTRGPRIIDESVRAEMGRILEEIRDGRFAAEWVAENRSGRARFNQLRAEGAAHPIEKVGAELRAMMPFVGGGRARPQDVSGG